MSNDRYLLDAAFSEHRKQYSEITDQGDAFEIFTADFVLRRRRLSIDEVCNGVVGGSQDGGIDTIFIFVNGRLIQDESELPNTKTDVRIELFFFQSKHSIKVEQVILQKLQSSLKLFLELEPDQEKLDKRFNSDLQAKARLYRTVINKYRMTEYTVKYHIVYCCRSSNEPNDMFNDLASDLIVACENQLGTATATFMYYGARKLYQVSVQPNHTRKELIIPLAGQIGNDDNYIALVRLGDFLTFITDGGGFDDNMFEFNVRDFEGNTKPVN